MEGEETEEAIIGGSGMQADYIASHCLTNFTTVLDIVLGYLSSKQLCAAACVCWFWNVSAKRIKSKRKQLLTKLKSIPDDEENEFSMDLIGDSFQSFVTDSKIQPLAAVVYMNRSDEYFESMNHQKSIKTSIKKIFTALPPRSHLVGCLGGGVIGCNDLKSVEVEQSECASLLLLPSINDVQVGQFFLTLTDIRKPCRDKNKLRELMGWQDNVETKLVLLHAACDGEDIEKAINLVLEVYGDDIIIAGGQAESVFYNQKVRIRGISCICFSGKVRASIAVHKDRNCGTTNSMFSSLEKLKNSVQPDDNSVVFMYSCVARGLGLYSQANVETTWISEVLPRTPVVGMFAFGEIGYDPSLANEHKDGTLSALHSYTTVLCLCKFGNS